MAIREILTVGNPALRNVAKEVPLEELQSKAFQGMIDDLIETMLDANGAGLAAPQIGEPWRVFAVHVKDNPRYPYKPNIPLQVLINAKLIALDEETFENYEGCLSVPALRGKVKRYAKIRIEAFDRNGNALSFEAKGLTAGTYQHEADHCDGLLFIDKVYDTKTIATWKDFDRFHKEETIRYATEIVKKYGG